MNRIIAVPRLLILLLLSLAAPPFHAPAFADQTSEKVREKIVKAVSGGSIEPALRDSLLSYVKSDDKPLPDSLLLAAFGKSGPAGESEKEALLITWLFRHRSDPGSVIKMFDRVPRSERTKYFFAFDVFLARYLVPTHWLMAKGLLEDITSDINNAPDEIPLVNERLSLLLPLESFMSRSGSEEAPQAILKMLKGSVGLRAERQALVGNALGLWKQKASPIAEWYLSNYATTAGDIQLCLDYFHQYPNSVARSSLIPSKIQQLRQALAVISPDAMREAGRGDSSNLQSGALPLAPVSTNYNLDLPEVGKPAPPFNMADMNGQRRSLDEFRAKKSLLLTFFPQCFTGSCANHLSSLGDVYSRLKADNVEVLAVSVDPPEGEKGQKAFAAMWKLPFPLLPDTQRVLSMAYGAAELPTQLAARQTVFIDKQGVVQWVDREVNVGSHGPDVLKRLLESGVLPK